METTILTVDYYDGIRALIAPDVEDNQISDDYLSQHPFAPEAERKVRKRMTDAEIDVGELSTELKTLLRSAMMHECAALLCLTVPQMLQQGVEDLTTRVQTIDWKEKRVFHLSQVEEIVNDIIEIATTGTAANTRTRANPFTAVGTERKEIGSSVRPFRRVPITFIGG
jgi:hypothetical protein